MTISTERYNSIVHARMLLNDLLDPKKTPKVHSDIRRRAKMALRHFPSSFEMNEVAAALPNQWESNGALEEDMSSVATDLSDVSQKLKNSDTSF